MKSLPRRRWWVGLVAVWALSGCCPKNAGMFVFGTHLRVSVGFRPYIFSWGVPSYVPERTWWCFYGSLGWRTVSSSTPFVCRPCRASSRDISHGTHITAVRLQALPFMILCHIARQARHFWKNFFLRGFGMRILGCFAGLRFQGGEGCVWLSNRVNIIIF